MIVLLDTGILGLVASPQNTGEAKECQKWFESLLARSASVVTSDICDYEVRRGLLLASMTKPNVAGIDRLDTLQKIICFLPLTKKVMKEAAQLWAEARSQGMQTADNKNIDADIIISAHWKLLTEEYPGQYVVVATKNVKHLRLFAEAREWKNIKF